MTFRQSPSRSQITLRNVMSVNPTSFVNVTGKFASSYVVEFSFNVFVGKNSKDVQDYESVVVTVFDAAKAKNQTNSSGRGIKTGVTPFSLGMGSKLSSKLFSGLDAVADSLKTEEYVAKGTRHISSEVKASANVLYAQTKLVEEKSTKRPVALSVKSKFDPTDVIRRINREKIDPTVVASPGFNLRNASPILIDAYDYFMKGVKSKSDTSPNTAKIVKVVETIQDLRLTQVLLLPKSAAKSKLSVRFDLVRKVSGKVDETITMPFDLASMISAIDSPKKPPTLHVSPIISPKGRRSYQIRITDNESAGMIRGFKLYIKTVAETGACSPYTLIGTVENRHVTDFSHSLQRGLEILRVVPIDPTGKESGVYSSAVLGEGYDSLGNPTLLVSQVNDKVNLSIINLPPGTQTVTLHKRDCTASPDDPFKVLSTNRASGASFSYADAAVKPGRTYEYTASISAYDSHVKRYVTYTTAYVMHNHRTSAAAGGNYVTVSISNQKTTIGSDGSASVTFSITTQVPPRESENITNTLRSELGEVYNQYLNPSNNSSSPISSIYRDIFFHEITRTCLDTGVRETFNIVGDGQFDDGPVSQRLSHVSPIDPQFRYLYQVQTFKKNPLELFRKYVVHGVSTSGREWFYRPLKWKNPRALNGVLDAEGEEGPVVDENTNLTSESYGITASYTSSTTTAYTEISNVLAERVDVDAVKITWQIPPGSNDLYECFVIASVVNGERRLIGRTKDTYFHHSLTASDVGRVHYIVIPFTKEFDVDNAAYSQDLLIQPDGLIPPVKVLLSFNFS